MASTSSVNCWEQTTEHEDSKMSEEIIEMYCEDCEKDLGTIITADGFCENCFEYLCSTCIRYHKKHLPQHRLQTSANMPKDFCFDKCNKHPSEIIKFYCNLCDVEACAQCKRENHETCTDISHIPALVKSKAVADEIRDVSKSIDNALEELAVKKIQAASSLNQAQSNNSDICKAIHNHKELLKRKLCLQHKHLLTDQNEKEMYEIEKHELKRAKIIAQLDEEKAGLIKQLKVEKETLMQQLQTKCNDVSNQINKTAENLLKESEQKNKANFHNIQTVLSNIDKTEAEIYEMKKSMDSKKKTGQKSGLFVAMKHVKSDMKKLRSEVKKTNWDNEVCNYEFEAKTDNLNLERFQNKIIFGHLIDKSVVKRNLAYEGVIDIKPSKRSKSTCITGLCKINRVLVIVCKDSKCIKLIDEKQKYEKSSITLDTEPFDVTTVGTKQLALTLPDAKKVMFIDVTKDEKLIWSNEIDIGKKCYGIDSVKPKLIIVACQDPGCVEILRLNGEPIRILSNFTAPQYISVDQVSGLLYVEDNDNKAVDQSKKWTIKKTNDVGEIKQTVYSHSSNGVAVDNNGAVYVYQKPLLYRRTDPLHQLSRNLEDVQSIESCTISGGGSCLYFCNKELKLYIGTTWGNIVSFKVK